MPTRMPLKSSEVREEQRSLEKQGIRVRFNGKDREIPGTRRRISVEMGLEVERFRASHDTLKELAARAGVNVARFVETPGRGNSAPETGNQTAEGEQTLLDQMNGEFEMLAEAVPDIRSVEDIPEEVFTPAVAQKLPLYDAYLCFRYEEERRQKSEQGETGCGPASSAGSLRDTGERHPARRTTPLFPLSEGNTLRTIKERMKEKWRSIRWLLQRK